MAVSVVYTNNLGNEFDLGNIEANKIHIKTNSTIIRDPLTGELGVDPAALAITNALALTGSTLESTVSGQMASVDLLPAIQAGETVTVLGYDPATTMLSYTDEDGNVTAVDLSALTSDIYVDGASFDATSMMLTLTDNDGGTPDVVVDLSSLVMTITNNGDGTYTFVQGSNSVVVDTKDGVSADAGNLASLGSDGLPFVSASAIRQLADVEVQDAFGVTLYYAFSSNA